MGRIDVGIDSRIVPEADSVHQDLERLDAEHGNEAVARSWIADSRATEDIMSTAMRVYLTDVSNITPDELIT
jgi:hypothetical protein